MLHDTIEHIFAVQNFLEKKIGEHFKTTFTLHLLDK